MSAHPIFPVIVMLWFAALFGIGSMVVPGAMFDSLSSALHLGAIVPAAAPPLGLTAHLFIAIGAALLGAACGFLLARKVASAQAVAPVRRREIKDTKEPDIQLSESIRKPLSVNDDIGDDAAEAQNGSSRRRPLAMAEREGPSDWFQPNVPFADQDEGDPVYSLSPMEMDSSVEAAPEALSTDSDSTLDLDGFSSEDNVEEPVTSARQKMPSALMEVSTLSDEPEDAETVVMMPQFDEAASEDPVRMVEPPVFDAAQSDFANPQGEEPMSQEELSLEVEADPDCFETDLQPSLSELTERLASAIKAQGERLRERQQSTAVEQAAATAPFATDAPMAEDGGVSSYFSAPAAELSAPGPSDRAVFANESEQVWDDDEDSAQTLTDVDFSRPALRDVHAARPGQTILSAMQPVDLGEPDVDEDEDDLLPRSLTGENSAKEHVGIAPDSPFAVPVGFATTDYEPEAGEDVEESIMSEAGEDDSYSSLLSMKNPFRGPAEPIRIEQPEDEEGAIEPAVIFPGQQARRGFLGSQSKPTPVNASQVQTSGFARKADGHQPDVHSPAAGQPRPFDRPADRDDDTTETPDQHVTPQVKSDPAETERALRSALATLQRISGAA